MKQLKDNGIKELIRLVKNELKGYSKTNHTHSNYSLATHNHDSVYSKTNHTHDYSNIYAAKGHVHDDRYITTEVTGQDQKHLGDLTIMDKNMIHMYDDYNDLPSTRINGNCINLRQNGKTVVTITPLGIISNGKFVVNF